MSVHEIYNIADKRPILSGLGIYNYLNVLLFLALVSLSYFSITVFREVLDAWTNVTSCCARSLWEAWLCLAEHTFVIYLDKVYHLVCDHMRNVEAERKSITDDCKDNLLLISSVVTAPARRAEQTFRILQPVFF